MRALILVVAFFFGCPEGAFIGSYTLDSTVSNEADLFLQQGASETSADIKTKIQNLSSPNPRERAEAACALGESHLATAIPALIRTLGDDAPVEEPVCGQKGRWGQLGANKTSPGEMAAVALSRIGRESVGPLIGVLNNAAWQARANAVFALGLIRDGQSINPLIAATQDSDWHVREKAAWSLGLAGDRRAVEPLTIALKDSDWNVRAQAAWALGLKGDERAVEPLLLALKDAEWRVRSQAAWALGLKGDDRAV